MLRIAAKKTVFDPYESVEIHNRSVHILDKMRSKTVFEVSIMAIFVQEKQLKTYRNKDRAWYRALQAFETAFFGLVQRSVYFGHLYWFLPGPIEKGDTHFFIEIR